MTKHTDKNIQQWAKEMAEQIWKESIDMDQALERATERAEWHDAVIYYEDAHDLCQNSTIDDAEEEYLSYGAQNLRYDTLAVAIAHTKIRMEIEAELERTKP